MPTVVTALKVLEVMVLRGPGVYSQLGPICAALGVPNEFREEKALKGEVADSNGGAMRVHNALKKLTRQGLVISERTNDTGPFLYSLAPDAVRKLYGSYPTGPANS